MSDIYQWLSGLSDGQWTLLLVVECVLIVFAMWGGAAIVRRRDRKWVESLRDTCDLPGCCGTRGKGNHDS